MSEKLPMQSAHLEHLCICDLTSVHMTMNRDRTRLKTTPIGVASAIVRILQILLPISEDSLSAWVYPPRGAPAPPTHGAHILGSTSIHHPSHGVVMYLRRV